MKILIILLFPILCLSSCYSFQGVDIGDATTYAITGFDDLTARANADYMQLLEEELRQEINGKTRLVEVKPNEKPNIEFSGQVNRYDIAEQAANAQDETAFNRFIITLKVSMIDNLNNKKSWDKTFTEGEPLDESITFPFSDLDQELDLINTLNERLVEKIFNAAFTNW